MQRLRQLGNLAKMSVILIGKGAPETPAITVDPGGITTTSAPMPAWQALESFRIPNDNPTISRMSVTSNAIATMLIKERIEADGPGWRRSFCSS